MSRPARHDEHGAEIAAAVSRRPVFAVHRDSGRRQFVEHPLPDVPDTSLGPLLAWAEKHLGTGLTVNGLAARAAISPATPHRRFRAQLGTTPLGRLTERRITLACRTMERGAERLDVVARAGGPGTATNLRAQLRRRTGLPPGEYRRRFTPTR